MFNIKKSLRVALAVREWDIARLATEMNKPKGTVTSAIYNGNPTLDTISDIAKALGYPLSDFIKLGEK